METAERRFAVVQSVPVDTPLADISYELQRQEA